MMKLRGRPPTRTPQVGEKFGLWGVVGVPIGVGKSIRIPCRCECGFEKAQLKNNLLRGITKGCKKCYGLRRTSTDVVPGWVYSVLVANARQRGVRVEITREYLERLYLAQNGLCAFSGCPIGFARNSSHRSESTASLDRKDSHLNYVEGNVQWVHKTPNMMKGILGEAEFLAWVGAIAGHRETPALTDFPASSIARFRRAS